MLTWPQNAGNPTSKNHYNKLKFTEDPHKTDSLQGFVSPTPFSKIQYLPQQTTLNHSVSLS